MNLEECPHCGSTAGYYTKTQVRGSVKFHYNFDGSEANNSEMYDHLHHTNGNVAYCVTCEKKLFNMNDR